MGNIVAQVPAAGDLKRMRIFGSAGDLSVVKSTPGDGDEKKALTAEIDNVCNNTMNDVASGS